MRLEERLLLEALERRGVDHVLVDPRRLAIELHAPVLPYSGALIREISHTRNAYLARLLESAGLPVVNRAEVVDTCGDKLRTTLVLRRAGVPIPRAVVAFGDAPALEALDRLGYPAVIKPVIGSWGRLGARVRDRDEAEQILEHRAALPGPQHRLAFIQEYVDKPGRDIKAYVMGGTVVAAIYKRSTSWRTNTARGGIAEPCPLTCDLVEIVRRAAHAVGGGVLGVDVFEAPDGLLVNEINHTPEFHGAAAVSTVDIAASYVDYTVQTLYY
jgi:[lysine-biosynthesis-protein LysW]--L-2-aminoadipate ligase